MICPKWNKCDRKGCIEQERCVKKKRFDFDSKGDRELLFTRSLYSIRCPICEQIYGTKDERTNKSIIKTKDHIVPKSKGGSNHRFNIFYMCGLCNVKKGDLSLYEFIQLLERKKNTYQQHVWEKSPLRIMLPNVVTLENFLQPYHKSMFRHQNSEYQKQYTRQPSDSTDESRPPLPPLWYNLLKK